MKMLGKIVWGALGVVMLSACSEDAKVLKEVGAVQVEVYSPSLVAEKGFYVSGQVTAKQTAAISTRMMGYIEKIYVKPGDKVSSGQLLVAVSNEDVLAKKAQVDAMIAEAEAAAQNAQRDYERYQVLHKQSSVSDKELENVALQNTFMQAKVKVAHEQMKEVDAMLAYTSIKAPFSGVITQKMMDEGSMATPGVSILMLEQDGEQQIVASVPENYISNVKMGDPVKIDVKSLGIVMNGSISELSPSAYGTGGQYGIKISFDSQKAVGVHAGMYVNVLVPEQKSEESVSTIMLDAASIVYRDQLTGVYVVNDNQEAVLRWVRLGKSVDNQIEVLSGLSQQDKIIRNIEGNLYNGRKVSIAN